jgi:3-hydroxyisobutyrate dehydrogenase-like beta-hydroxyacid dehydrogenase
MGAAVGKVLVDAGKPVHWASEGRSEGSRRRAEQAGLTDLGTVERLAASCEIVLSICPPHAAVETATSFRDYGGLYADLNAVSPATTTDVGKHVARFTDGGIVGPPPVKAGTTRLYLSGDEAATVAALFQGTALDARVLGARAGDASALKMVYAAWTKGSTAMLLAVRAAARALDVEDGLVAEWELSQPALLERSERSAQLGLERGWRWAFELEEIGRTFGAAGLPDGFGAAAAEIFGRLHGDGDLETALGQLTTPDGQESA